MVDGPPDGDPLALERQVCFALSVAARGVVAVYRPLLEPMGLTHPQYLVMLALWEHEPLSVRELSGLLQLDPGTLSPLLKRLEAAGYLRRERDPADERILAVALTAAGGRCGSAPSRSPRRSWRGSGCRGRATDLHGALTGVIAAANGAVAAPAAPLGRRPRRRAARYPPHGRCDGRPAGVGDLKDRRDRDGGPGSASA